MGCEGREHFDPDPPTTYPDAVAGAGLPGYTDQGRQYGHGGAWEDRILGMWNSLLEMLTDQDLGHGGGR
jgi:hypothetical protein